MSADFHGLQPPPGVTLLDRLMAQTEARERAQAAQPDMMQQMMTAMAMMLKQQSTMVALLTALVTKLEEGKK